MDWVTIFTGIQMGKKYRFCEQLQKSIYFGYDTLIHCCSCDIDRSPTFVHYYSGQRVNWRAVVDEKLKLQEDAKNGKVPFTSCENCHCFKEADWDEGGYINELVISHWTRCNCNCFYCYTARSKKNFNNHQHYALMPLLRDMKSMGVLKFDGIVRFLGGDVAMLEEIDELIKFFLDRGSRHLYIPTSGIKFLPMLEEVLAKGAGEVIVSPDCGNVELYKKIKRVDAYAQVKETMRKYSLAAQRGNSIFRSKYIVIPYVNDTKEAVDEWLQTCVELGIKYVADDCEENFIEKYSGEIPAHIPELMEYIHKRAEELGLKIDRFRYAFQLFYELEQGSARVTKSREKEEEQKNFVENLLRR